MLIPLADGLTIRSYSTQDQALDASILSSVLPRVVYDGVVVRPCYLRVVEDGTEHYFAAFHLQKVGATGAVEGESLLLAVNQGDEITPETVWIPPKLIDGEVFSLKDFSRGVIESTETE